MSFTSHMQLALEQAKLAARAGEVPVGAVLVDRYGAVLVMAHNRVESRNDPSAHAELLAIRAACETLKTPRLPDCDLYVTLEPCPMCAQVISFARIRRLYFGAPDPKGGGVLHGPRLYTQSTCHHRPEVYDGIMEAECAALLRQFFRQRRH